MVGLTAPCHWASWPADFSETRNGYWIEAKIPVWDFEAARFLRKYISKSQKRSLCHDLRPDKFHLNVISIHQSEARDPWRLYTTSYQASWYINRARASSRARIVHFHLSSSCSSRNIMYSSCLVSFVLWSSFCHPGTCWSLDNGAFILILEALSFDRTPRMIPQLSSFDSL